MPTVSQAADRRAARRERTRAQIVDAAWRLAERDGIAALSLRDLAEQVGMRAPSLYGYFASKDAIYDAMFAQGYQELDATLQALATDGDALERQALLTAGATAFLAFCGQNLPRYQLMFTRVIPGWRPSPDAYAASLASYEAMTGWLAALGIDDPRAVDLWTSITAGLAAQQAANDPGGDRYTRLAGDAVAMFLHHLERSPHPSPLHPEDER